MIWSDVTTIWLVVAMLGVAAAGATLVLYRHERKRAVPPLDRATCHYIDRELVMGLYRLGGAALRREIEQTVRRDRRFAVGAGAQGVRIGAGHDGMEQQVIRFVDQAEPITVIWPIIEGLNRDGHLIHVDIANQTAELNRLAGPNDSQTVRLSRLPGLAYYCAFTGTFQPEQVGDEIRLTAQFGTESLSIRCQKDEVLHPFPRDEPFNATCLGRVARWSTTSESLVVEPVLAVFL